MRAALITLLDDIHRVGQAAARVGEATLVFAIAYAAIKLVG